MQKNSVNALALKAKNAEINYTYLALPAVMSLKSVRVVRKLGRFWAGGGRPKMLIGEK